MLFLFLLCCPCQGWWCGDKEVEWDSGKCDCSGEEITLSDHYDNYKGCCPPPGPGHCEVTSERDVKCYNSTFYNDQYQPCNGECNWSSKTDCPAVNITQGSGHQQCYTRYYKNDGTYNCRNRGDEELITLEDKGEDIRDYSSVVPCDNPTDSGGDPVPGLKCDDTCLATSYWCSWHRSCGSFTINNAKLCQNYTLLNKRLYPVF